jgi:MFS family permease
LTAAARRSLWRHGDFLKLWTGQSVSLFGSQVTKLALPTAAIQVLGAGPLQVGVLGALDAAAFPVLGLVAGVWADRVRRRGILIASDALRLVALASVPAAYALGLLTMAHLYVVAAVAGAGAVLFTVAYASYLPTLVRREELVDGNARLQMGSSFAEMGGYALAGGLIQAIRAAPAILVDALTYVASAVSLIAIRAGEPEPVRRTGTAARSFLRELFEGVRVVAGEPTLRLITISVAVANLGTGVVTAVFLVYAYRQLGLSPGGVGLVFAGGGIGALVGALAVGPLSRRAGPGPAMALAAAVADLYPFLVPVAGLGAALPVLALSRLLSSAGVTVYNVCAVSLCQTRLPAHLQGRVNASIRTITSGVIPAGSVAGGVLGVTIGVVPTILVGAVTCTLALVALLAGPAHVRGLEAEPA